MARMMIAFVGAYILGRMKKFKLAIAWFGLMTGYQLKLSPEQLLEQSSRLVEASPQLQQLVAALRGPLLEAVKQAATSTATTQLSGLTDNLVSRIDNLGRASERAPSATSSAGSGPSEGARKEDDRDHDEPARAGRPDRGSGSNASRAPSRRTHITEGARSSSGAANATAGDSEDRPRRPRRR